MPGKKKKFIDKNSAVSFHLVHRSQRDPLQADDEASQRVFMETGGDKEAESRKVEQRKFGVFYEDDYDYLQHLRDHEEINDLRPGDVIRLGGNNRREENLGDTSGQGPKLQLPSSVFASEVETQTGLLNKGFAVKGPQPSWDPDVVAALDDDFDFNDPDNILEDDFIIQANTEAGMDMSVDDGIGTDGRRRPDYADDELFGSDCEIASDEAEFSDVDSNGGQIGDYGKDLFQEEETKSRFTNYSLSSSVMHRNEGLTLLDDRFEKLYEQYEDTEIGALDHEELEGGIGEGNHLLNTLLDQFQDQQILKEKTLKDILESGEITVESDGDSGVEDKDLVKIEIEEPTHKWDCESILSTYSNIYNHPRLISEPRKEKIQLTTKLGIPVGVLSPPGLTQKQLEREMREVTVGDRAATYRPRDESQEEKRDRKQAVKAERKERRAEKKANKVAFKMEKQRQDHEIQNVQRNLQGVKIT